MKSIEQYEQLAREAKAEGCRHENRDHLKSGEAVQWDEGPLAGHVALCEQLRCVDCGAWLSLGRSRITKSVRVELTAARLATDPDAVFSTARSDACAA